MALVFLVVLGAVIFAYHFSAISTHKIFHHTYYTEKGIAMMDGVMAISRGVVQQNLDAIIEKLKKGQKSDLADVEGLDGGLTGAVKQRAETVGLMDEDAGRGIRPDLKVEVTMLEKDAFKTPYTTVKGDDKEMVGKLEITVELGFSGFRSDVDFRVPKRIGRTQYEFKKIRAIPSFFRHFSLFVRNGITKDEKEDEYNDTTSNFNHLINDREGNQATQGGAIFLDNGAGLPSSGIPKAAKKEDNPFYQQLPYVYLGGGKNKAYLNLTAGGGKGDRQQDSIYGEDFHLYRGQTTDFYNVVSTEFENFIRGNKKRRGAAGAQPGGAPPKRGFMGWLRDKFRGAVSGLINLVKAGADIMRALDNLETDNPKLQSSNLPVYYVVNKDYGYAADWGTNPAFQRFGFGGGPVVSTSLHLYGGRSSGSVPSPTVVLGNVYRRCLSLSGFKQHRAEDPSTERKFEVQAGPIEYFKTIDDLFGRSCDWSKSENSGGPIWVWDARMDWSRAEGDDAIDGQYVPISGQGLFGRLVPGLQRLKTADDSLHNKLFVASIMPHPKVFGSGTASNEGTDPQRNGTDSNEDIEGSVSPLFLSFQSNAGFEVTRDTSILGLAFTDKHILEGSIFGPLNKGQNSPYFEELLRNFAFVSAPIKAATLDQMKPNIKNCLKDAGGTWRNIVAAVETEASFKNKTLVVPISSIADGAKQSKWAGQIIGTDKGLFPWSLPDPWSNRGKEKITDNFEAVLDSTGQSKQLFDKYFKPLMTNPGRSVPYNRSLRYWFEDLQDLFTEEGEAKLKSIAEEAAPEVRDATFGYLEEAGNDYMKPKDGVSTDPAMGDDILQAILAKRKGDAKLQRGYFFMDEYGSADAPGKVSLTDVFPGERFCYKEMDQAMFDARFVKVGGGPPGAPQGGAGASTPPMGDKIVTLGTVVKVKNLSIGDCTVHGGGAILSDTPIKITGSIHSVGGEGPLVLKAPGFEIDPRVDTIQASLVATDKFQFGGTGDCTIEGNLVAEKWDPASWNSGTGSRKRIRFNSDMKSDPTNARYLHCLEPKARKYVLESAQ